MTEVNIPLLRKAVEWAEAEAAKPTGGLWLQQWWVSRPDTSDSYVRALRAKNGLDETCGTAYCIAGYICKEVLGGVTHSPPERAAEALGIEYDLFHDDCAANRLFSATNTIEDVRRIAEEIAGERL